MKKLFYAVLLIALLGGAFVSGSWYGRKGVDQKGAAAGRKVLYYVDPMNPAHTTNKPGRAPCGMDMEPVYADDACGAGFGEKSFCCLRER